MKRARAVKTPGSLPPPEPLVAISVLPLPAWERADLSALIDLDLSANAAATEKRTSYINYCLAASLEFDNKRISAGQAIAEAAAQAAATSGAAAAADWGDVSLSAEVWEAAGADGSARDLTAYKSGYTGRPLQGSTSGSLYISAEYVAGAPPRLRDRWRYNVGPGSDGLKMGAETVLDPARSNELREELKRPAFPDRAFPHRLFAPAQRAIAIASGFDDELIAQQRIDQLSRSTLMAQLNESLLVATDD